MKLTDDIAAGPGPDRRARLLDLARLFLRLGVTAFGGPAAHIAMMEDEVVGRRAWLSREAFIDMISACNLIPGPNSTEMAIHIGHQQAGLSGLLVAGAAFIVPAMLITVAVAWGYVRFGSLPEVGGMLYGVKPVIIAIVAQALWRLGRTVVRSPLSGALVLVGTIAGIMGANEIAILFATGVFTIALYLATHGMKLDPRAALAAVPAAPALKAAAAPALKTVAVAAPFSLGAMFLFFAKVGSVLFGSGYVLLAFLQADLVERLHWLTQAQLLDAVAVGQITPGPVFSTATFIGYLLGGGVGAVVATVGIFMPAFFFVSISGPLLPRLRRSPLAGAFLDGVNAASLALMVVVTWQLGRAAIIDLPTAIMALVGAVILLRYRLNSAWLVIGSAAVGALLILVRH